MSEAIADTNVPIIVVLTKAFSKNISNELIAAILEEEINALQVIRVLAEDYEIDLENGKEKIVTLFNEALEKKREEE